MLLTLQPADWDGECGITHVHLGRRQPADLPTKHQRQLPLARLSLLRQLLLLLLRKCTYAAPRVAIMFCRCCWF